MEERINNWNDIFLRYLSNKDISGVRHEALEVAKLHRDWIEKEPIIVAASIWVCYRMNNSSLIFEPGTFNIEDFIDQMDNIIDNESEGLIPHNVNDLTILRTKEEILNLVSYYLTI